MPTWYEISNASGFYTIEWANASRGDPTKSWAVRCKDANLSVGKDAEDALAALVASGKATELRLPKKLIDWNYKRR